MKRLPYDKYWGFPSLGFVFGGYTTPVTPLRVMLPFEDFPPFKVIEGEPIRVYMYEPTKDKKTRKETEFDSVLRLCNCCGSAYFEVPDGRGYKSGALIDYDIEFLDRPARKRE
jgi:hypothetical protein